MAHILQCTEPTRATIEDRRRQIDGGADAEEEEDGDSLEKLEEEVKDMAEKLTHYRSTFSDRLKSTLASVLAAQRPELPIFDDGFETGPSGNPDQLKIHIGSFDDSRIEVFAAEEDQDTVAKICFLKDKIFDSVSAIPIILNRMDKCTSRIDKLNSSNRTIHPAFRRKKS